MIVYGYAKDYKYSGDGTLLVRVRIPSIHGPIDQKEYKGQPVRQYVLDQDLPYYPSVLLPHLPRDGEVVALSTMKGDNSGEFLILGLTGGSYYKNSTNRGE